MKPMRIRVLVLVIVAVAASVVPSSATPPLPQQVPTPVLSYDGQGFATFWKGQIVAIARQGSRHWDDPTGRISLYTFSDGNMDWPPTTMVDTDLDDRNAAGGVTRKGSLIFFYARIKDKESGWVDLNAVRIDKDGNRSQFAVPTWPDGSFSAYGPLINLPSGRLVQTLYGWGYYNGIFKWRTRVVFSNDDGRTWKEQRIIQLTNHTQPNETAAVYVDGKTDKTSRLIAFSRSARRDKNNNWQAFLQQSVSHDGGWTWRTVGWVGSAVARGVVPWVADIGGGRLALITVIRDPEHMTINVSVAKAKDVFYNSKAWPAPRAIYRSTLQTSQQIKYGQFGQAKNYGDFGYPSIVQAGPRDDQKFVVFYDSHTGDSGLEPYDVPADTDLIMRPLFGPPIE